MAVPTGVDEARGDDRRVRVELRCVADGLEFAQNFQVLYEAFGDLLAFGVVIKIVEAERFAFAGQREFGIERGPVQFVTEFEADDRDAGRFEFREERRVVRVGQLRVGVRERRAAPHLGILLRLVRPLRRVGRVLRAQDQFDRDARGLEALGKVDAFIIVGDAASHDLHARRVELRDQGVLVVDLGALRVDDVHAGDERRSARGSGRAEPTRERDETDGGDPESRHGAHFVKRRFGTVISPPPCS